MPAPAVTLALAITFLAASGVARPAAKVSRAAAGREVAGLRVGLSLDEVRAVLAAHRPPFPAPDAHAVELPRLPGPRFVPDVTSSLSGASLESTSETVTVYFTPPPLPSRVFGVERAVAVAPGERLTEAALKKTLERAYGKAVFSSPPTKPDQGEAVIAWSWLPGGAVAKHEPSACRAAFDRLTAAGFWWTDLGAAPPAIPADCGSFIDARYVLARDGSGRVERLRLGLFDLQALRAAAEATQQEARAARPH